MQSIKSDKHLLNKNGHLNECAIGKYVDEHIHNESSTLPNEILNHIEDCQECKLAVFDVYEIIKKSTVSSKEVGKNLAPIVTKKYHFYQIATGLFILLIPISLFFVLTSKSPEYEPNPVLEHYLNINYRGNDVTLVSPPLSASVSVPVQFEWTKTEEESVQLVILNHKAKPVKTMTVTENTFTLEAALSPGLYYWKLLGDEGVLLVGKFLIK